MMQSRCRACETIRAVLTLLLRVRLHHRRTQWINRGASVQVMAMKYINAPQSTGVAVGTEQFIHRMRLHTFQAYETPHFGDKAFGAGEGEFVEFNNAWHVRGIGRTHKVTRSDIVGTGSSVSALLIASEKMTFTYPTFMSDFFLAFV
jgi:hypothetical protein